MKRALLLLLILFAYFRPTSAFADDSVDPYVEDLVAKARSLRLADDRAWLRLGHYRKTLMGGWESEADGKRFYLAAEGKKNPAAELEATIRGIYSPPVQDEKIQHPLCRFPARTMWLNKALGLDVSKFPDVSCERFAEFMNLIQPRSVTLVFSSYYLNNPASAFGHTFLRINKSDPFSPTERRELIDYGIDYSANVDTGNAVIYAFKGLTGMFPGTFHRIPYYYKVREYNDYESRDLWEYELNLTPEQVTFFAAHLWELGATYFDYYYLTENCSYHVLGALEAAAPDVDLLSHIKFPVIPADTVKALFANPDFVKRVRYRPSIRSQFHRRILGLSDEQLDLVSILVEKPETALPESLTTKERVHVFDAALDLVDIRYAKELILKKDGSKGAKIKQRLMERRAAMEVPSETVDFGTPGKKMPQLGHGSQRVGAGGGYMDALGPFASIDGRLALHDLADSPVGYPELSGIEFLPTRLRYYPEKQSVRLEDSYLVRIVSLSAMDRFDYPISWKFKFGATAVRDKECRDCTAGIAEVGSGATLSSEGGGAAAFLMADAQLLASPQIRNVEDLPFRLGLGPSGGFRFRITDDLLTLWTGQWILFPAQNPPWVWTVDLDLRWKFHEHIAIDALFRRQEMTAEGQLQLLYYF